VREVVLLHPPSTYSGGANPFSLMPVGIFSLAARLLEEGFDVEIVNVPLEAQLAGARYADVLRGLEAEVYAISLNWFVHADGALETAKLIKMINPSAKVVVGGLTATVFAEEVAGSGYVDAVVLGEGEEALMKYVEYAVRGSQPPDWRGLYAKVGRRWVRGGLAEPPPLERVRYAEGFRAMRHAREYLKTGILGFVPAQQPHFWFAVARGCLFDCIYCGGSREGYGFAMGRASMAVRDPAAVAEEMAQLSEAGLRIARLTHDPQMLGDRWWRKLFEEVRGRGLDLKLYWESHRLPAPHLVREASRTFAALDVAVSPETASEEVRFRAKRYFTNDALVKALDALKGAGALVELFFLLGLPGETVETARLIPRFASKLVEGRGYAAIYPLIPYTIDPNCPMALHPERYGVRLIFRSLRDYARAARGRKTEDFIGHETRELSRRQIAALIEELNGELSKIPQSEAATLKLEFEERP
jgi:radical SAM superfamily enzyme YgiQ (UPF0313 family)